MEKPIHGSFPVSGPWIGVDPGAKRTGLVLRNGADCLGWRTIVRAHTETEIGPGPEYWTAIETGINDLTNAAHHAGIPTPLLAIEGITRPKGFVGGKREFADPTSLIALGMTFAAIYNTHPEAVIIPPGGNGSGMLTTYPEQLITPGERRGGLRRKALGNSLVSHARSAWDLAGLAPRVRR